jgi:hypothetical protein
MSNKTGPTLPDSTVATPTLTQATLPGFEEDKDTVNHPHHYTEHPSGVECIQITEHMGFNLGNAMKYIWRADLKGKALEDLRKAAWYIGREIARREAAERDA